MYRISQISHIRNKRANKTNKWLPRKLSAPRWNEAESESNVCPEARAIAIFRHLTRVYYDHYSLHGRRSALIVVTLIILVAYVRFNKGLQNIPFTIIYHPGCIKHYLLVDFFIWFYVCITKYGIRTISEIRIIYVFIFSNACILQDFKQRYHFHALCFVLTVVW